VPDSIEAYNKVTVLNSNVFSCGTLPENDHDIDTYKCGSSNLENAIYVWLAMIFVFAIIFWLFKYFLVHLGESMTRIYTQWESETSDWSVLSYATEFIKLTRIILCPYPIAPYHIISYHIIS
jgi:hypothetical protein